MVAAIHGHGAGASLLFFHGLACVPFGGMAIIIDVGTPHPKLPPTHPHPHPLSHPHPPTHTRTQNQKNPKKHSSTSCSWRRSRTPRSSRGSSARRWPNVFWRLIEVCVEKRVRRRSRERDSRPHRQTKAKSDQCPPALSGGRAGGRAADGGGSRRGAEGRGCVDAGREEGRVVGGFPLEGCVEIEAGWGEAGMAGATLYIFIQTGAQRTNTIDDRLFVLGR